MKKYKVIKIGSKLLKENNNKTYVIAEAGVAHFGNLDKGKKLIDLAAKSGADAVKFQAYQTEDLVDSNYSAWFKRYKSKEVSIEFFKKLKKYSLKKKIEFLLTPHTESTISFIKKLNIPIIKVGSGEIGNFIFLKKLIRLRLPIIISTGMHEYNDLIKLKNFFRKYKFNKVIFMKCISLYPTKINGINLINFEFFRKIFKDYFVGYSDHTDHDKAIIGSIFMGARVVEKHIALDFKVKNAQDWKVSFNLKKMSSMVTNIRNIEKILGQKQILISNQEKKSIIWATRSIYAKNDLKVGDKIKEKNIKFLRPGKYLKCSDFLKYKNLKLKKFVKKNQPIKLTDIEKI